MAGRERFVPQRTGQLTQDLSALPWPEDRDGEKFRAFARLVAALYHYEFHDREQAIIDAWDTVAESPDAAQILTAELTGLLDGANYTPLSKAELDEAMERDSLIPLRLDVDLSDYDEVLIYRRSSYERTVEIPKFRGLRTQERTITVDERVVVHTRVKSQDWFDEHGIDPQDRNLIPGHVSLKLFQNVPRADIEMLLPSTQVRFRPIDTIMVGVPAVASGVVVLGTKLLPTLGLIFLLVGAGLGLREDTPTLDQTALLILLGGVLTLGGFFFRQWTKLKNRRVEYLKTLSENLYFRTLADGPGVLHTLLSTAEQQEVIEVLLAYRFLLASESATATELDVAIERWLRDSCQDDIDFEVDDAIAKLRRLGIVEGRRILRPQPLASTLATLDRRWDDLFRYQPSNDGGAASDADSSRAADTVAPASGGARGSLIRLRQVIDRFSGRFGDRRLKRQG